jgi:hypothetical protein
MGRLQRPCAAVTGAGTVLSSLTDSWKNSWSVQVAESGVGAIAGKLNPYLHCGTQPSLPDAQSADKLMADCRVLRPVAVTGHGRLCGLSTLNSTA